MYDHYTDIIETRGPYDDAVRRSMNHHEDDFRTSRFPAVECICATTGGTGRDGTGPTQEAIATRNGAEGQARLMGTSPVFFLSIFFFFCLFFSFFFFLVASFPWSTRQ